MALTEDELRNIYYRLQQVRAELILARRRVDGYDLALASLIQGADDAVADATYEARDLLWERREPSLESRSLKAV